MQELVQSVERALSILETLSEYENGLGITEISNKVELHKSTVHRLLATLIAKGYVKQNQGNNNYILTMKLFELGNKKIEKMNIANVSRSYLQSLVNETNEVVHLVIREGNEIVYISKVESQNIIRMHSRIGSRKPAYCTAVGKAMLAYLPEEEVRSIWDSSKIEKITEYTVTDFQQFSKALKEIKQSGYAREEQENETGIRCVAAAIFDYTGEVCGAISISGSIISYTEEKKEKFAKLVMEYALKISRELGYISY